MIIRLFTYKPALCEYERRVRSSDTDGPPAHTTASTILGSGFQGEERQVGQGQTGRRSQSNFFHGNAWVYALMQLFCELS